MRKLWIAAAVCLAGSALEASDWLRFRGPNGAGVTEDKGLPVSWSLEENLAWKTELPGAGTSSPIVVGQKIFLTCYTGYAVERKKDSAGDIKDLKRHLLCLDRDRGKILWMRSVPAAMPEAQIQTYLELHGYASSTPASDGKHVYVFFGRSGVLAYDLDGKQLWETSVGKGTHGWGSGTSPVLHGNLVIINASVESRSLVALDKKTGTEVWRAKDIDASWNTPVLVKVAGGKTELVLGASRQMLGFNPDTGKALWHADSFNWYICPSVVAHEGVVYALQHNVCVAVRAGGRGDVTASHTLWNKNFGSVVSSPVYYQGNIYWASDSLNCLRARDGEVLYRQRLKPGPDRIYASPLAGDGKIYLVSRTAGAYVIEAGPKFKLLAHNTLDPSVFNASPVASNSQLLLRSDRFLYCIGRK